MSNMLFTKTIYMIAKQAVFYPKKMCSMGAEPAPNHPYTYIQCYYNAIVVAPGLVHCWACCGDRYNCAPDCQMANWPSVSSGSDIYPQHKSSFTRPPCTLHIIYAYNCKMHGFNCKQTRILYSAVLVVVRLCILLVCTRMVIISWDLSISWL